MKRSFFGRAQWLDWWKSRDTMQGHEMQYEVHVLDRYPSDGITWISIDGRTASLGDHSPRLSFYVVILNFKIIEVSLYNSYHTIDEEDN